MVKIKIKIPHVSINPFDLLMMLLSFMSLIIAFFIIFMKLNNSTRDLLRYIDFFICCIFMASFLFNLFAAKDKEGYLKKQSIDLIASIPLIEILRFARIFQIIRTIKIIRNSSSIIKPLMLHKHKTTMAGLLFGITTVIVVSSLLILFAEHGVEGANIKTAEDAIWWSIVTISTVGYGDHFPISTNGHIVGGVVILAGVSFFGVISGYMASLFINPETENINNENEDISRAIIHKLEDIEAKQRIILNELEMMKNKFN